jgi:RNA polymerase sigma-70 factor (ECF subfamily)
MTEVVTEEQIRLIYRATIEALYGFVSRRCGGDRELAEDITQEAWMRAVRDWRAKGVPEKPIAWLTTVARHLLLNHLRRGRVIPLELVAAEGDLLDMNHGSNDDAADITYAVRRALARLPLGQSHLLEAFHYDRQRVADLAASLGISERAVEGRLRRARENLRREIESAAHEQGDLS